MCVNIPVEALMETWAVGPFAKVYMVYLVWSVLRYMRGC